MTHFQSLPIFTYLRSEQNARSFLQSVYHQRGESNPGQISYQNTVPFMYACMHGIELFESGQRAPLLTRPLLFFYACVHLFKGLLISVNPFYPSSTKQLSHGISSRKRKKKQYAFLDDEVRIQRDGLLPIAATHIFHTPMHPHTSYSMQQLLALIPEMQSLFTYQGETYVDHVGFREERVLYFSEALLNKHHLSIKGMLNKLKPYIPKIGQVKKVGKSYEVDLQKHVQHGPHPFFIELTTGKLFFPNRQSLFTVIDELLIYYMILYNLSMISRYELEWWGDTITTKATTDAPLIEHFLHIVSVKFPSLIHGQMTEIHGGNFC